MESAGTQPWSVSPQNNMAVATAMPAIVARPPSKPGRTRREGSVGAAGRLYVSGRSVSKKKAWRSPMPPVGAG